MPDNLGGPLPAPARITDRPTPAQLSDRSVVSDEAMVEASEQARMRLQEAIDLLTRLRTHSVGRARTSSDVAWRQISAEIDAAQRLHRSLGPDPCGWKTYALLRQDAVAAVTAAHEVADLVRERLVALLPGGALRGSAPEPPASMVADMVAWLQAEGVATGTLPTGCTCPPSNADPADGGHGDSCGS